MVNNNKLVSPFLKWVGGKRQLLPSIMDNFNNPDLQMRSVWSIPIQPPSEKMFGKHPTQNTLALLRYIVKASTKPGDIIIDPCNVGGITGIASAIFGERKYIGCDLNKDYNYGVILPFPAYEANAQAWSGYPLQSFCTTQKTNAAKRITASIPNAKYRLAA